MNNEQIIYTTAIQAGVPDQVARHMVEQAKVESHNFTSNVFITSHNAFGMKMPSKRKSKYIIGVSPVNPPTIEGGAGYAAYKNLQDSTLDLIDYFNYRKVDWDKIRDINDYSAYLKARGYYGPDQEVYTNAMLRYAKSALDAIGTAIRQHDGITIATGLTLVAMFSFFIVKVVKGKK